MVSGVSEVAKYISDVIDGKKDAPPKSDIRGNPINDIPNGVVNSTPFKQYFNNFGFNGIF
jgi:hypothetical protein